ADELRTLYRLFQGPIATTLENKREAFVPVDPVQPGKMVYPWGVTKDEIEAFVAANPAAREELLGVRTVVRRADEASIAADLATLGRHPVLETLHPGLRAKLEGLRNSKTGPGFYAVPYAVAYGDAMVRAHALLH